MEGLDILEVRDRLVEDHFCPALASLLGPAPDVLELSAPRSPLVRHSASGGALRVALSALRVLEPAAHLALGRR